MSQGDCCQRRSHFAHEDTEHGEELGSRIRGGRGECQIGSHDICSQQSRKTYLLFNKDEVQRPWTGGGSTPFLDPAEASAHVDVDKHSPIIISLRPMHKSASSVPFEAGSDMCRLEEKNMEGIALKEWSYTCLECH
jgi:hypothetical protein